MNKIKKLLISASAIVALVLPVAAAPAAFAAADIQGSLCTGSSLTVGAPDANACNGGEATNSVNTLIATIINIFSFVVGVVAVIMIIIGGFRYVTSGGDSANVSGAKNTIL